MLTVTSAIGGDGGEGGHEAVPDLVGSVVGGEQKECWRRGAIGHASGSDPRPPRAPAGAGDRRSNVGVRGGARERRGGNTVGSNTVLPAGARSNVGVREHRVRVLR